MENITAVIMARLQLPPLETEDGRASDRKVAWTVAEFFKPPSLASKSLCLNLNLSAGAFSYEVYHYLLDVRLLLRSATVQVFALLPSTSLSCLESVSSHPRYAQQSAAQSP